MKLLMWIWKSIRIQLIFIFSIVFLCFLNISCALNQNYTFDGIYSLEASSKERATNYGTCFYIDGLFVTNAHLVTYSFENNEVFYETIIAKSFSGDKTYELIPVNVDYNHDCCTLETSDYDGLTLQYDKTYKHNIGDEIFSVGNLNNYGLAYSFGKITSTTKYISNLGNEIPYVQTNIEISGGCSGGPVFNAAHKVIGLMSMKLVSKYGESIDGASFYIPLNFIDII